MARRVVPWLGIAALMIGYPLLAHYANESGHSRNFGALVSIAPVVLIDAVGMALADRTLVNAHGLRPRRSDAAQLLAHILIACPVR
jgi:hypothetical protein